MDTQLLSQAIQMVGEVFGKLKPEDYEKPTPCSEWDVRELSNHIVNEIAWIEPLVQGKTIEEVGSAFDGDLIANEPLVSWQKYTTAASGAAIVAAPDAIAHLSYGDKSAEAYVKEVAADVIVHGWDLAKALNVDYEIEDSLVPAILDATKEIMPMAREGGLIGEQIPTDASASPQERLLAAFGRSNNWSSDKK